MPRVSRRLVIDASVARASGGAEATFPTSKHCRDFLTAVLTICHRLVMTPEVSEEWDHHQSNFARRWRVSMVARKKLHLVDSALDDAWCDRIAQAAVGERERRAMQKDCRLVHAALTTDRSVVSLDEEVRSLFTEAARHIGELKDIVWVNPDKLEEQPIPWLESGAKPEKSRQLGFGPGS